MTTAPQMTPAQARQAAWARALFEPCPPEPDIDEPDFEEPQDDPTLGEVLALGVVLFVVLVLPYVVFLRALWVWGMS
jgi:hypothetical protein